MSYTVYTIEQIETSKEREEYLSVSCFWSEHELLEDAQQEAKLLTKEQVVIHKNYLVP